MAKKVLPRDDSDSPWKDGLHYYLPFFLKFFFADIHVDIDWSRGYEALDKEFQQIIRHAKVGKLIADKLFKVWLRDGTEQWLYIHIEIQGNYEHGFSERIFDYNVAIRRLYKKTVVSLAVLCDDRADWLPTTFGYGRWGCWMGLRFRIAKLMNCREDSEAQENRGNPFAAVVAAHLEAQRTKHDAESRRQSKLRLIKELYKGNWSKDDVRRLFRLIDWIMSLPKELEDSFRTEVFQFEQELNMPYLSSIERHGFEMGREEGREEGLAEGIAFALEAKFGKAPPGLIRKLHSLGGPSELREFAEFVKTAKSLAEVRKWLS